MSTLGDEVTIKIDPSWLVTVPTLPIYDFKSASKTAADLPFHGIWAGHTVLGKTEHA